MSLLLLLVVAEKFWFDIEEKIATKKKTVFTQQKATKKKIQEVHFKGRNSGKKKILKKEQSL